MTQSSRRRSACTRSLAKSDLGRPIGGEARITEGSRCIRARANISVFYISLLRYSSFPHSPYIRLASSSGCHCIIGRCSVALSLPDSEIICAYQDPIFWSALFFTLKYTLYLTPILMILGYLFALLTLGTSGLVKLTRATIFIPVVIGIGSSSLLWVWLFQPQIGLFKTARRHSHHPQAGKELCIRPNERHR